MKPVILATLLGLFLILPIPAFAEQPTIITGEEIRESGIMRLSDIYLLLDDWAITTIDGYTWTASPGGLSSFYNQQWFFMIDNIPLDIDILGSRNLGRLSLNMYEIDYIEIYTEPVFYGGIFADAGLINIHTLEPTGEFDPSFEISAGNETKDPGPLRYTEHATPNVDKIGRSYSGGIGVSSVSSYMVLSFRDDVSYYTDPNIIDRTMPLMNSEYPRQEMLGMLGRFSRSKQNYNLQGLASWSRTKDIFYDFRRGNEIPAEPRLVTGAVSGRVKLKRNLSLHPRFSFSDKRINKRGEQEYFGKFDWEQKSLHANLDMQYRSDKINGLVGISIRSFKLETGYELSDNSIELLSLYGSFTTRLFEKLNTGLDAELVSGDHTGYKILLSTDLEILSNITAGYSIGLFKKYPEEFNFYQLWRERGYLQQRYTGFDYSALDQPQRKLTMDLNLEFDLHEHLSLTQSVSYREFRNIHIEQLAITPLSENQYLLSATLNRLLTAEGHIIAYQSRMDFSLLDELSGYLFYRYQSSFVSDNSFEDYFGNIAAHRTGFNIRYQPAQDIVLRLKGTYQSDSYWPEYNDLDDYTSALDGFLTVDFSIMKIFWNNRIRGSLAFRNIFDDTIQYHPIGAEFDRSYYAVLQFMPF